MVEPDPGMPEDAQPTVSVVLPARNERGWIRDCLDSLLAQDYPNLIEILVVDGGSTDGTVLLAEALDPIIRTIANPRVTAAAAMNIGLAEAKGQILCRVDAHARYAADYVRRCVDLLVSSGADNVGGSMRPVGTTNFGRAVAAATTSRFGVGPGAFHFADAVGEVDTVWLGCWRRETLDALGGYDEDSLQWAAEDQELNHRIRKRGGRILLSPAIRSWYFPRDTPRALARQYFNYGLAKASTIAKHGDLPSYRPLAPAGLVGATVVLAVCGRRWRRFALPLAHLGACAIASVGPSRDPGVAPHRVTGAFVICHWAYGAGFWAGMGRVARRRPFDTRPAGSEPR
ncbi:MAG: glycosyl transferase [Acidimicrobiales bacterium]|jgi:succinoglycan biosynthesis protein ExoA|nr:glycosyl transferase [Acidimicrobiales bacterium]